MSTSTEERRGSPRAQVLVRIECRSQHRYVVGNLENISALGMLVSAAETFAVAEEVGVRFVLPPRNSGKVVEATACVLRSAERQSMAFRFTTLSDKSRQAIAEYLAAPPAATPAASPAEPKPGPTA